MVKPASPPAEEKSGEDGEAEAKPEKKAKKSLLGRGAELVPVLIIGYACFTAQRLHSNIYPTFPEFDANHRYLQKWKNRVPVGASLRIEIYVKEGKSQPVINQKDTPAWKFKIKYDWDSFKPKSSLVQANVSQKLLESRKNVWLIAWLFTKQGNHIAQAYGKMIKYTKKPPKATKYWLLSGNVCLHHQEKAYGPKKDQRIARGIPKMQVRLVYDRTHYPEPWRYQDYWPTMYVDEFWLTEDQLVKFNTTGTNTFGVDMHFSLMSDARHRFQHMMEESFKKNAEVFGEDSEELESMRDLFANTHPYLLISTLVVSVLHCIFEYLALKNDVQFWKRTDAVTLSQFISMRTVMMEIFCNTVLLIYLWDQESNYLVLILSLGVVVVDCWKLTRVLKFSCPRRAMGIPLPLVESRVQKTLSEDYDKIAIRYLSAGLIPICLGYGVFSAYKECHKSWASFLLHTLATMVYALGFALMSPQLFINYRMKSVANLPWRRFVYRAINTFIDDLFSFIIKMPTMHRMSCFRDDVIFVVYLYQRRIYPVDMSRNFDSDEGDDADAKKSN